MGADSPAIHPNVGAHAPTVSLELESRPETLTLVRGMLGGVAELLVMDPELLDDLKTAVSEACNNVVLHAYHGEIGAARRRADAGVDRIEAIVRDARLRDHGDGTPPTTRSTASACR